MSYSLVLDPGLQIQPDASGGATGYYIINSSITVNELLVSDSAYVYKGLNPILATNLNTSTAIDSGHNITLPARDDVIFLNITDIASTSTVGIRIFTNGTGSYPNMTTGTHYVSYRYEQASYTKGINSTLLGGVIIVAIVGLIIFAVNSFSGGGLDANSMLIIGGGLIVAIIMVTFIARFITDNNRTPAGISSESIVFEYNNTYYPTAQTPIYELLGVYSDSALTHAYDDSLYEFKN